jgi:hypothetical protein
MMSNSALPALVLSDPEGNIIDHPSLKLLGRSGDRFLLPPSSELVPLPEGSQLFTLPGRIPIGWDDGRRAFAPLRKLGLKNKEVECIALWLPSCRQDSSVHFFPPHN